MDRETKLVRALQWCSGSADFNTGGKARRGWLKLCAPLLRAPNRRKRRTQATNNVRDAIALLRVARDRIYDCQPDDKLVERIDDFVAQWHQ